MAVNKTAKGLYIGSGQATYGGGTWQGIKTRSDSMIIVDDNVGLTHNITDMDSDIQELRLQVEMLYAELEMKDKQIKRAQEDIRYVFQYMRLRP